jgi:hypothetical protein
VAAEAGGDPTERGVVLVGTGGGQDLAGEGVRREPGNEECQLVGAELQALAAVPLVGIGGGGVGDPAGQRNLMVVAGLAEAQEIQIGPETRVGLVPLSPDLVAVDGRHQCGSRRSAVAGRLIRAAGGR